MSRNYSKERINEIREIFNVFDNNGSGSISTKEVGNLYRALGFTPTEVELNQIIFELDTDKSGAVEFNEFLEMFSKYDIKPFTEKQLIEAFRLFDKDRNGLMSLDELMNIFQIAGSPISNNEAEMIIKHFDFDNNGSVNYNEFAALVLSKDI